MSFKVLRRIIREVLSEELGRNFHTINTDPISFKDFADYEVDIIVTSTYKYTLSVLYRGKKLMPVRNYNTREEAELAARNVVERHRLSNSD